MTTADRQVADSSVACDVSKVGTDEKCGSDVKDLNKFVVGAVADADCNGNGGTAVVVDANGGSKDDSDDSYVFVTNGTDEVSADPTSDTADVIIAQSDSGSCLVSNGGDAVVEMKEFARDDGLPSSAETESNCIVPEIAHGVCLEVQVQEFSAENGATTAGYSVVDTSCILRETGNGDAYLGEPPSEKKAAEAAGDVNGPVNVETESRDHGLCRVKVDDRIEPESARNGGDEAGIPNGAVSPEAKTDDVGVDNGLKVDDQIESEIAGNLEDAGRELNGTASLDVVSPDHFNCVKVEDQIKSIEALVDANDSVNVEAGSGDHVECGVKVDARIEPHSPPNWIEAETLNGTVCLEADDGVADSGLRVGDQTESEITPNLVNAVEELTGGASLEGVSQDHLNCEAKVEDEIEPLSTPSSVDAVGGPLGYVDGVEAKPQDHVTMAVKVEDPLEPESVPPIDEVKELERTVGLEAYSDNPPSSVAKVEYQIQPESSDNLIDAVVELNETASIVEAESVDLVSTSELVEDWVAPDSAPTSVELTADPAERPESSTRSVESGDVMAKHAEESNLDEIVALSEINTSQNEVLEYETTEMALGEVKVQEEPQLHLKADVKESPESITQDSNSVELDEIHVKEMDEEVIKSEVQPELDVSGKVEESSVPLVDMKSVEYDNGEVEKINDEEPNLDVNGQVEGRSMSLVVTNAVDYEKEEVEEMDDENLKIADEVHESLNVAGNNGQSNLHLEIEASDLADGSLTHSEMEEGGDETMLLPIVSETASEMLFASENEASQAKHQCIVITHLANVIKEPSETETFSGLISNTNIDAEAKALVESKTANDLASPDDKASQTEEVSKFIDAQLSNSSENMRCLPSFECSNPETEDGVLVAENADSSLVGPDSVILENEVGDSASTMTVDVAPFGIKVSDDGAEIENIGGERSQTALACSIDDAVPNIHVKNGPVGGETILTFPAEYVSSETVIEFGSIGSHAKASISRHDDATLVSVFGQSSAIGSRGMPDDDAVQPMSEILDSSVSGKEIGPNSIAEVADGENINIPETEDREGIHSDGLPTSSVEGSVSGAIDGQNEEAEILPRPFNFLIRIPRFEDESLREEIRNAQLQVVEKTQQRDVIRAEIQIKKAHCQTCSERFDAARIGATTARRQVRLKRQEIDVVQAVINRVKNAISVEDIDSRIYGMEHMIEHETLPLKEEKQLIREIKQLKLLREQLSSNMGSQDEVEQALDQKDHIEERLKSLRKELESLKDEVSKADAAAIAAKKKLDDERRKESELKAQFRAADDVRQQAYMHFVSLKRQLYDKSKNFRTYKDDLMAARDFASRGDKEALHRLCGDQVETLMELWNTDDEFRKEYIRCNMSTGRRYRTLDGLALGPDEEPPTLPVDDKADRKLVTIPGQSKSISVVSTVEQEMPISSLLGDNQTVDKAREKLAMKNKQIAKSEETVEYNLVSGPATVSGRDEAPEVRKEEDTMQTREEQEFSRKEEELRKEETAAKLKEQRRLEEKAKAEAALERKKRNAEKAQLRAELRAQKEAEQREKEKEKRLRKKEKKMLSTGDGQDGNNNSEESESSPEITSQEGEAVVRESHGATISRRPQKQPPHVLARQLNKPKPIPPALMNKNKKRMQYYLKMASFVALMLAVLFLSHTAMVHNFSKEKGFRPRGPGNGMY